MAREEANEQSTDQQSRCEIDKILTQEGECQRLGEVQFDGSLLCVSHADLLRLKDRSETMLGVVFELDQWLESVEGQADELRVRRIEHQRNEVVEQLRFDRTQIALIRDQLLKTTMNQHRGMPLVRLCASLIQRRLRGRANREAPGRAI